MPVVMDTSKFGVRPSGYSHKLVVGVPGSMVSKAGGAKVVISGAVPGPRGASATIPSRRHEFIDPYDYSAQAEIGSLDSAEVWTITRITISPSGSVVIETAENVAWDDRLTVIYS